MFCIILQGQFSVTDALIFPLKSASDAIALYSFERIFHNLGLKHKGVSMLYIVMHGSSLTKSANLFLGGKVFRSFLKYH